MIKDIRSRRAVDWFNLRKIELALPQRPYWPVAREIERRARPWDAWVP